MIVLTIAVLLCDVALCLTVASPVAAILGAQMNVFLPALVISASAVVSALLSRRGRLRLLTLLMLPAAYILCRELVGMFWITPAVFYVLMITAKSQYGGIVERFEDSFLLQMILVAICGLGSSIYSPGTGAFALSIIFVGVGFIRLRCLRHTRRVLEYVPAFHLDNLGTVLVVLGFTLALTGTVIGIYRLICALIPPIVIEGGNAPTAIPGVTYEVFRDSPAPNSLPPLATAPPMIQAERKNMLVAQIVLFAAIFVIIGIVLLRRMQKRRSTPVPRGNVRSYDSDESEDPKQRRSGSDSDTVRRIYRKLLHYMESRGIPVPISYTSEDVNIRAKDATGLDTLCDEMRTIYARARYSASSERITREDVARMKSLAAQVRRKLPDMRDDWEKNDTNKTKRFGL